MQPRPASQLLWRLLHDRYQNCEQNVYKIGGDKNRQQVGGKMHKGSKDMCWKSTQASYFSENFQLGIILPHEKQYIYRSSIFYQFAVERRNKYMKANNKYWNLTTRGPSKYRWVKEKEIWTEYTLRCLDKERTLFFTLTAYVMHCFADTRSKQTRLSGADSIRVNRSRLRKYCRRLPNEVWNV
jgi:hypothetical protein